MRIEDQQKVVSFMKKKKNFLVFLGGTGNGKNSLGASLMEWILTSFNHYRIYNEDTLFSKVQSSYNSFERGSTTDYIQYLLDDDFIMINDLGSNTIKDDRRDIMFRAIDYRWNTMKPTVITSNLTRQEIDECFGRRIYSRLFDTENIIIEWFDCPDYRLIEKDL